MDKELYPMRHQAVERSLYLDFLRNLRQATRSLSTRSECLLHILKRNTSFLVSFRRPGRSLISSRLSTKPSRGSGTGPSAEEMDNLDGGGADTSLESREGAAGG